MSDPTSRHALSISRATYRARRTPQLRIDRVRGRQVFGTIGSTSVELSSWDRIELYVLGEDGVAGYAGQASPVLSTQYRAARAGHRRTRPGSHPLALREIGGAS